MVILQKGKMRRGSTKNLHASLMLCLSHMYVNEYHENHLEVDYVSAHTNHELGAKEMPYLALPRV